MQIRCTIGRMVDAVPANYTMKGFTFMMCEIEEDEKKCDSEPPSGCPRMKFRVAFGKEFPAEVELVVVGSATKLTLIVGGFMVLCAIGMVAYFIF